MDELIRKLALFGRPFPPELRGLYLEVAERHSERPRGPGQLAKNNAEAAKGELFESRAPAGRSTSTPIARRMPAQQARAPKSRLRGWRMKIVE